MQKSRPCRFCRRWFVPDLRVGERQRACGGSECQRRRRSATQASWRGRNRDYRAARRIQGRREQERPETPVVRRPLDCLPWDVAQDDLSAAGAEFLVLMAEVIVRHMKDQIARQVRVKVEETGRHARVGMKDEISP